MSLILVGLILHSEGLSFDFNCHVRYGFLPTMIFPKTMQKHFYNSNQYEHFNILDNCIYYMYFPAYNSQRSSDKI
jgi:hypothetical protein